MVSSSHDCVYYNSTTDNEIDMDEITGVADIKEVKYD
jgi:hypothetical protein